MKNDLYNYLISSTGMSLPEICANYLAACIIGVIIYTTYRLSHARAVYSKKFNVTLVMLVMITTLIMNIIGNNIALSLGMVGALSIIRFRTAIKDSRDAAFIFWAIAAGIACGVSDYLVAGIGSLLLFLYLTFLGLAKDNEKYMLVAHVDLEKIDEYMGMIAVMFDNRAKLSVYTANPAQSTGEIIYEFTAKQMQSAKKKNNFSVHKISALDGVTMASLVQQESDVNQ